MVVSQGNRGKRHLNDARARRLLAACVALFLPVALFSLVWPSDSAHAAPSTPTWTQLTPSASPSARMGAAMAYDATTSTVVLFGGYAGPSSTSDACSVLQYQCGTWTWDGASWTQRFPATSPGVGTADAAMTYDRATGNVDTVKAGMNGYFDVDSFQTWTW